ncbi:hypothetical protein [Chryseobacterium sp. sg2396]|uniref:hypothetical protein n=1 Tax=Chryseobacterium sp. sg2396 TaxID=3276280 RepID=UPI00366BA58F
MKKFFLLVLMVSLLSSCKKQDYVSTPDNEYIDTLTLGKEIEQEFKENPPQKFVETEISYPNELDEPIKNIKEATEHANNYSKAQIEKGEEAMRQVNESHRKMNEEYERSKMLQSIPSSQEINEYSPLPSYDREETKALRYVNSIKEKSSNNNSSDDVRVRSYIKSNGTYVEPHMRTAPNQTTYDNYSTSPNINPYTGKVGTK